MSVVTTKLLISMDSLSLVPRPSPAPVFELLDLQNKQTGAGEGLETRLGRSGSEQHTNTNC